MIHETFIASNPQNAYKLAVDKYGTQITLVSARQIKYEDDLLRSEITVAIPQALFQKASLLDESIDNNDEKMLLGEISELKSQLDQMKSELQLDIQGKGGALSKVKTLFEEKGISPYWVDSMLGSLVGSEIIDDPQLLSAYLIEEIDEAIKVQKEDLSEPKIMMIVGPTGGGKTTTIAKLAARYTFLLDRPYKVAFVNLDTFKVSAIEQLAYYADIMQIKHVVVNNVDDFKETLEELKGYDVVLVDTAGMSPYDTEKFIQTVEFVRADSPKKIEVHLLLSATVKYEDMEDIYQNFSFLNLSSLIISKFDETKHFGTLLNFMLLYNLPISYFTNGQEVPDDLLVADKEYLLEQFIGDVNEE